MPQSRRGPGIIHPASFNCLAWVLTLPAAMLISGSLYAIFSRMF
ncbi:MAG TPA: hypothetical protein VG145_11125 [Xanthobacteraceae bacterium]|nr:hypothetical protein [Xanthobacteraceae bacterium]